MNTDLLLVMVIVLAVANLALIVRLMARASSNNAEQAVRSELRDGREEAAKRSHELREEVSGSLDKTAQTLSTTVGQLGNVQKQQLESVTTQVQALVETNQQRLEGLRATISEQLGIPWRAIDAMAFQGHSKKSLLAIRGPTISAFIQSRSCNQSGII